MTQASLFNSKSALPPRALVNPTADFLLLGGLSAIVLGICFVLTDALNIELKEEAYVWAGYITYIINYPHFAYSYLLFYEGYTKRLLGPGTEPLGRVRLFVAGLLVPALMLAFFVYAYFNKSPELLALAVFVMIFSVGWHYVKQGYGVLITMSVYKNVFYALWEKRILWINAYAVWGYSWCRTNSTGGELNYRHLKFNALDYPTWLVDSSFYFACFTSAACIAVVLNRWLVENRGISFNAVLGYVSAIYMWVMVPFVNMSFYVFIPMFHSLQYLPFVYKYKKSELVRELERPLGNYKKSLRRFIVHALLFTASGVALGTVFFETIPNTLDDTYGMTLENAALDPYFFLIAFIVFINVHHFFIDSAFWRRDNKDVQHNLFRA
jgi:hypothetical protein